MVEKIRGGAKVVKAEASAGDFEEDSITPAPVRVVHLDALTVLQIFKSKDLSGRLIGVEEKGELKVTNSFATPNIVLSGRERENSNSALNPSAGITGISGIVTAPAAGHSSAEEADDAKNMDESEAAYAVKMMELLRSNEFETNEVGWYAAYPTLNIATDAIIETQFAYQSVNPQAIHLMYQPTRTSYQKPKLTAIRLSDSFLSFFGSKTFTGKKVKEFSISYDKIFETLPIKVKNSFLLDAALGCCLQYSTSSVESGESTASLFGDADQFMVSTEKLVERQLETLIETIEDQGQEVWRWQTWYKGFQKEQQKVQGYVSRLNHENDVAIKRGDGAAVHNEDVLANAATSPALNKSIAAEPGRLDTLLLSHIIHQTLNGVAELTKMIPSSEMEGSEVAPAIVDEE